jgi:hypothetical protein
LDIPLVAEGQAATEAACTATAAAGTATAAVGRAG